MVPRKPLAFLGLGLTLGVVLAANPGPAEDNRLKEDENLLRQQGVGTDSAGLLAFLRRRTPTADQQEKVAALIRQLGHKRFILRNRAEKELLRYGRLARPSLARALKDPDLEIADRAQRCLGRIDNGPGPFLPAAAVRLLARRRPAGTVQALLDYVPFADDDSVEEEILIALRALGAPQGKAEPALVKALADPRAARRAAAAYVVGRLKDPGHRPAVVKLLQDGAARVRFRAAQGLLAAKDKRAVATLVDLLADGPLEITERVEVLLLHIAGERTAGIYREGESAAERKKWRDAWARWWDAHGSKIDLANIPEQPPFLNLTVLPEMNANKVWECGPDGKERWQITDLRTPIDAHALPTGRVLVAEMEGNRVTERDRQGKVRWQFKVQRPVVCQRLANGNTYIGTNHKVFEVTPAGKEVFAYSPEGSFYIHSSHRLANGHVVCLSMSGIVCEVNAAGKEVRSLQLNQAGGRNWSGVEGLPGNRYLVADCAKGDVFEVDAAGKTLWQFQMANACYANRLPNGNTLVAGGTKVVEVTKKGKVVWTKNTATTLWRVHRR
jgi:HEAT repeats/PQQ-like domain